MSYDAFGNMTKIQVGAAANSGITLAEYDYGTDNRNLQTMYYGNGDHVDYTYDALDRVVREEHSDGKEYSYIYSSEGNLAEKVDEYNGDAVNYTYDSLGRLVNSYQTQEVNNTDRILQRTER